MAAKGKPNTAEPDETGKNPAQVVYIYTKKREICVRCESRWTEPGHLRCEVCESWAASYQAKQVRRKHPALKRDPNPRMLDVVISPDVRGHGYTVSIFADTGKVVTIRHLESVDIRDVRKGGKPKRTSYQSEEAAG